MNLFDGVHEVRVLCPSGIAVGYFDSWDQALRTVENEPSQYQAAYFTLNPLTLPAGIPVNPQTLTPARNTAGGSDIARRAWLLVDLDPPRPIKTSSSDTEKQATREQADRVREWLCSRGLARARCLWPIRGNGWHHALPVRTCRTTRPLTRTWCASVSWRRLQQLFPMVDAGNFNASRVCKLYGSWARKGEHTEERPHRRSAIVEAPTATNTRVCGTDKAVAAEYVQAQERKTGLCVSESNVKLQKLIGFLEHYSVPIQSACPPNHERRSGGD
jgi:hypothetical protein